VRPAQGARRAALRPRARRCAGVAAARVYSIRWPCPSSTPAAPVSRPAGVLARDRVCRAERHVVQYRCGDRLQRAAVGALAGRRRPDERFARCLLRLGAPLAVQLVSSQRRAGAATTSAAGTSARRRPTPDAAASPSPSARARVRSPSSASPPSPSRGALHCGLTHAGADLC
jgi:hypothetical protein